MYIGNDLQIANPSYKIIDDISSGFDGSTVSFALQVNGESPVPFPISTQQVTISVNGVIQEPDPSGSAGFKLLGSNIVFSSAPANGHAFFGVINAGADYVTAGSEFPDGSATAPSFTFQSDQDTGWFRSGSGAVNFSANGVNKVLFDGNGLTVTGTTTATTFSGSGASLTHLNLGDSNNTGTVNTARLGSGSSITTKFLRGDNTWQTVTGTTINNNANNRIITGSGTANTLEAESGLTWDGTNLDMGDDKKIRLGDSNEFELYYDSSSNLHLKSNHYVRVASDAGLWVWNNAESNWIAGFDPGGSCKLRDSGYTTRLETTTSGVTITGTATATTFSGSGASLTSLPAGQLTGSLPSISGANLTSLNATNLGSGTVPTARLGSGTASSSNFLRGDGSWQTAGGLTKDSSDNLIAGDNAGERFSGASDNIVLGDKAGRAITSGDQNIALGDRAFGLNSVSTTGSYNIGMGYQSMYACTSGSDNVAIGKMTGHDITTGASNVLIGEDAGKLITTGGWNIALGLTPGSAITTGSYNLTFGYYSASSLTTGTDNICLGRSTGGSNLTTGARNVCIGYGATPSSSSVSDEITLGDNSNTSKFRIPGINFILKDNGGTPSVGKVLTTDASGEGYWATGGVSSDAQENTIAGTGAGGSFSGTNATYNSLFGYRAGGGITTANGNTLMGRYAGYNTTTGAYNTSFGTNAGRTITTGSNNTCVGWRAGFTTLTTGSNNMLLGHMATASSASVSNEVTIGNTSVTKFRIPGLSVEADSTGVSDSKGNLRRIPYQGGYSSITLNATHAGQVLDVQSAVTVPNSVFSAGDAVTIINDGSSNCTITQASGLTMYNAADAATGNRALAAKGMCTIWFKTASTCFISGAGLS